MSKKDYEGYIKYNESIGYMLNNIAEMAIIIHKDFQNNGATHPAYIVEKLGRAKVDLDTLYQLAQMKLEENKEKGEN